MNGRRTWQLARPGGATAVVINREVIVGRGKKVHLRIDEVHVSRRHARLWIENGDLLVEDLGSSNGTYLNGQRLEMPAALAEGDRLRFDFTEFRVEVVSHAPPPSPPPQPDQTDTTFTVAETVIMRKAERPAETPARTPTIATPPAPPSPATTPAAAPRAERPEPARAPAPAVTSLDEDDSEGRHWSESARPIGAPERPKRKDDDDRGITSPTELGFDLGADEFEDEDN